MRLLEVTRPPSRLRLAEAQRSNERDRERLARRWEEHADALEAAADEAERRGRRDDVKHYRDLAPRWRREASLIRAGARELPPYLAK